MLLILFYCHYAPIWCYFRTNSATIQKYHFIFCNNDSEPGEEDLDDNDADANVNNIRPRPDRWHPAGAAVCQSCFFNTFTHWYSIIGRSLCFWKWGIAVTCFNNIISNRKLAFKYCIVFLLLQLSLFYYWSVTKGRMKGSVFYIYLTESKEIIKHTSWNACFFFPLEEFPRSGALPQRVFTVVSPGGYVFTFVFTIKRSLEVILALCLISADSQIKQEKHDST